MEGQPVEQLPEIRRLDRDGWMISPDRLDMADTGAALEEAFEIFPPADDLAADDRLRAEFASSQFAGMYSLPFPSPALNRVALHDEVLDLAAHLLGCEFPIAYQAQLWVKYQGAVEYAQTHHRDYAKNTMLAPAVGSGRDFLEMFVYLTDICAEDGPTAFVPAHLTESLPLEPARYSRETMPQLYKQEVLALGPAGSILCYTGDVFHRATSLVRPGGCRVSLKLAFKRREATWVGYHRGIRHGFEPEWSTFVAHATPRQLAAVGFPPPGHDALAGSDVWARARDRYVGAGQTLEELQHG